MSSKLAISKLTFNYKISKFNNSNNIEVYKKSRLLFGSAKYPPFLCKRSLKLI